MMKKLLFATLGLAGLVLLAVAFFLWRQSQAGGDPAFFEGEIVAFETADAQQPPPAGAIVFTGSSSIRLWDSLSEDMAPLPVIQRGFGGAHMEHVVHNARRIVTSYEPRAVVVFVGGNDIGSGKSSRRVIEDFRKFLDIVHTELPRTDVWLLSMKPSRLRWEKWPEMQKVDGALKEMAGADPRVFFVPTGRALLDEDGVPGDFYIFDGLHLNDEGYARWTGILRPRLFEAYGPEASFPLAPSVPRR